MLIEVPLRLGCGMNSREHWRARTKRVKTERETVTWYLVTRPKPATPCVVTITRVAPSAGLDDDNNVSAAKAVRDAIAAWLGIDDKDARVRYQCDQKRGDWCVLIEIAAL